VLASTSLNVTVSTAVNTLAIVQVSRARGSVLTTHFEVGSLQVGHEAVHLGLVCIMHLVFVRLGSQRARRNLLLKVAVLIMTDEISFRISIAHGVTSSWVVGVEGQVSVDLLVVRSKGQGALSDLEVTLSQLDPLVSDHLLVDVSTAQCFMCNGTAGVVVRHVLLLGQSIVPVRKVVVSNSALKLSNFFGVLLLGRVRRGCLEVDCVDASVLGDLSHSMAPVLFA